MSTWVPSGSDCAEQPLVSVLPPVPEQCAAWPRYVFVPSLNTKLAVHCAPCVNVWMPDAPSRCQPAPTLLPWSRRCRAQEVPCQGSRRLCDRSRCCLPLGNVRRKGPPAHSHAEGSSPAAGEVMHLTWPP